MSTDNICKNIFWKLINSPNKFSIIALSAIAQWRPLAKRNIGPISLADN